MAIQRPLLTAATATNNNNEFTISYKNELPTIDIMNLLDE